MHNTLKLVLAGVVGVIVGVVLITLLSSFRESAAPTGGSTTFGGDLVVEDFTATGGSATVTTTNTATSTLIAGCVNTYATSTDSPIKYVYTSSFTSTTTFPTGTNVSAGNGGLVAWEFGSCP